MVPFLYINSFALEISTIFLFASDDFIVSFYKDINTLFLLGSKILYISIRGFGNLGMSFLKKLIDTDEIGMTSS